MGAIDFSDRSSRQENPPGMGLCYYRRVPPIPGALLARSLEARGFTLSGDFWMKGRVPMIHRDFVRALDEAHSFRPSSAINDILTAIDMGWTWQFEVTKVSDNTWSFEIKPR